MSGRDSGICLGTGSEIGGGVGSGTGTGTRTGSGIGSGIEGGPGSCNEVWCHYNIIHMHSVCNNMYCAEQIFPQI